MTKTWTAVKRMLVKKEKIIYVKHRYTDFVVSLSLPSLDEK